MPVSSTTSRWDYNGDGATTVFPYDNLIFDATDLDVFVSDTLQTLNTDYTVSNVGDSGGGAVTFISGAPASGTSNVVIVRDVPLTQGTRLPGGGPFPSASVTEMVDRVTVLIQQINDLVSNKALALDVSDPAVSLGRLPLKSTLANTFLAFDSNGDPITAAGTSADLGPVSAFMDSLLDDGSDAAARATLGLGSVSTLDTIDELSEDLKLSGVISPTQLTASQNNYNPTDLATASTLRLTSNAAVNITGLQGGSNGRALILHNIGSFSITFVSESSSSTAANRFAFPSNVVLPPGNARIMQYDSTSSRWRTFGQMPSVTSATGTATRTTNDHDNLIACNAAGGAFTLTLPPAADAGNGFEIPFKKVDSTLNAITIDADGSETIDGASQFNLNVPWSGVRLRSDGTQWLNVSGSPEEYESAEISIVSGGAITVSHGMGRAPRHIEAWLICKIAEGGYAVGETVEHVAASSSSTASSQNTGAALVPSSTQITGRFGSQANTFAVPHKTTGARLTLANANWSLIIRAWT